MSGADIAPRIADEIAASGIELIASLPDNWIADLIETVDADTRFTHVPVNREESAIGLCSGAYFSGTGALALMGASGLMTCIYAITKINYTYEIPLFIMVTERGSMDDGAKFQISNGFYLHSLMQTINLPYAVIDIRDRNGNAPLGKTPGHREADSIGPSGDESNLVFKVRRHRPFFPILLPGSSAFQISIEA